MELIQLNNIKRYVSVVLISLIIGCTAAQIRTQEETLSLAKQAMSSATEIIKEVCGNPEMGRDVKQYCGGVRGAKNALQEAIDIYEGMLAGVESGTTTQAQVAGAIFEVGAKFTVLLARINDVR